jgi:uracil-DNA glycosylase family 4
MHRQDPDPSTSKERPVSITDDEIREKYLERAIRELNQFAHDLRACDACPHSQMTPVLGSGHPQADIMLIKHAARASEVEEGVAFYGRAGNALMKSLKRLDIDPLAVYGTLCVKCCVADPSLADPVCVARLVEEIEIVRPRILVLMGEETVRIVNELGLPLAEPVSWEPGVVQRLTPTREVLVVPDIDASLDDESDKRAFWDAFRSLGEWWAALPPW